MVTHEEARTVGCPNAVAHPPTERHRSWLRHALVPWVICALIVWLLDPSGCRRGERAVLHRGAGRRAARRRGSRRVVGAAVKLRSQLFPGRAQTHLHHRRTGQRGRRPSCLLLVAVAVAALVDGPQTGLGGPQASPKPNSSRTPLSRCCGAPTSARCSSVCARPSSAPVASSASPTTSKAVVRASGLDPVPGRLLADTAIEGRRRRVLDADVRQALAARDRRV